MPNWTLIIRDDLKAAGYGLIVDAAQTTDVGSVDPVAYAIESAVARVRRAVSAANALDVNPGKVPMSLKSLAVRVALFDLMERLQLPLSEDQRETRRGDVSDLNRLADHKLIVEKPDEADPDAIPKNRGMWGSENKILGRMHPTPRPAVQYPASNAYANPESPADLGENS